MNFWGPAPPWIKLVIMLVGASVVVILFDVKSWRWDYGIIHDIAIATIIAAILGFTVDRWLKQDVVRDVFQAAMGHVLPEEFKPELRQIINHTFLATRHHWKVKIENADTDVIRLTSMVERQIQNISSRPQELEAFVSMDEWGFSELSEILECSIEYDGEIIEAGRPERRIHDLCRRSQRKIAVAAGASARVFYKTTEIKRNNDERSDVFLCPTLRPEIEVEIPENLECNVEFGRSDYKTEKLRYSSRYIMLGTYFPAQHMRIRWWPKPQENTSDAL